MKTKLSQRVGVEYYIQVQGINDRLSTKPLAVWKYNITTCVKNIYAPYFKQVYIVYNIIYKLRVLMIGWVLNRWLYGSIISLHVLKMSTLHTSSRFVNTVYISAYWWYMEYRRRWSRDTGSGYEEDFMLHTSFRFAYKALANKIVKFKKFKMFGCLNRKYKNNAL